jgi:hypothetical protein
MGSMCLVYYCKFDFDTFVIGQSYFFKLMVVIEGAVSIEEVPNNLDAY